jgi:hypothetical protein
MRRIETLADRSLAALSPTFDHTYSAVGRSAPFEEDIAGAEGAGATDGRYATYYLWMFSESQVRQWRRSAFPCWRVSAWR